MGKLDTWRVAASGGAPLPDEAFQTLFESHWERICQVLFRLVGDRDEAEDLALEVFWRLYREPPEGGVSHNLGGWLYRVATNLGFNALRSSKRRRHYEQAAGEEWLESATTHPAVEVEQRADREAVRRVLAVMKPRAAQLLILRYSGLSYAELAEALGVSVGSVGTLLARAEQEFEQRYGAMEGGRDASHGW